MVTNSMLSYSGKNFGPPVTILRSIQSRGVGREIASEDWGKKFIKKYTVHLTHSRSGGTDAFPHI